MERRARWASSDSQESQEELNMFGKSKRPWLSRCVSMRTISFSSSSSSSSSRRFSSSSGRGWYAESDDSKKKTLGKTSSWKWKGWATINSFNCRSSKRAFSCRYDPQSYAQNFEDSEFCDQEDQETLSVVYSLASASARFSSPSLLSH